MFKVAKFEKVSFEQFKKDFLDIFGKDNQPMFNSDENMKSIETHIRKIYDDIKLPERATVGSAGYDFYAPFGFSLDANESLKIPTGIRVKIDDSWVLQCYPRSGLGFKYRMQLDNTVGIIDSDYYNSDNEGHIMAKVTNDGKENKTVNIDAGQGFIQGIFVQYGITVDDNTDGIRNGGFGSTT